MTAVKLTQCPVFLCIFSVLSLPGALWRVELSAAAAESIEDDIQLHLYTREHPIKHQLLSNQFVNATDFNATKPTVVVIHGFTGSGFVSSVTQIRDAFLYVEDVQVLIVHWERLAEGPDYTAAAANTEVVAARLADELQRLMSEEGLQQRDLHIVGFSLGAQVAGITGGAMDDKPARITGLDPARPKFERKDPTGRLDASDADFVLVLHTSGGFVSFEEPLGHADFYPNGGRSPQPHCVYDEFKAACSHMTAPEYFVESIYKPAAFPAVKCQSWRDFELGLCSDNEHAFMGPDTPTSTRGTFYLRTNADEPYGIGEVVDNAIDSPGQRTGRQHDPDNATERQSVQDGSGVSTNTAWASAVCWLAVAAARVV